MPVLVPLATGLDLVELLVWVSAQAVSEGRKRAYSRKRRDKRKRAERGSFWRFGGNLHGSLDQWSFRNLEVAIMEDMSGKVGV